MDPQSQNKYVYCINNPQKYTDPDGKEPITAAIIIGGGIIKGGLAVYDYAAENPEKFLTAEGKLEAGIKFGVGFLKGSVSTAGYMVGGIAGFVIDVGMDVVGDGTEQLARHMVGLDTSLPNLVEYGEGKAVKKGVRSGLTYSYDILGEAGLDIIIPDGPMNVFSFTSDFLISTGKMASNTGSGMVDVYSPPSIYDYREEQRILNIY